jgi:hypothetical protein
MSKLQRAKKLLPMGREIIGRELRRKKAAPPKKVSAALTVLDDLILDGILWHQSFTMILWEKKRVPDNEFRKSLLALLMRATQDATVVRNLMKDGYDVQARNILRSIDEHMDAIYYLC